MIVYGEGLRPWIEAALDPFPAGAQFIGRTVNCIPVAVVAFHSWTGENIELGVAALPGSGTRGLLDAIFGYVFGQLECVRCTARVRADNADSRRLVRRLGFVQEGVLRKAKAGHDVIVYGLLKEELTYGRRTVTTSGTGPQCDYPSPGAGQSCQSVFAIR